MSRGALSAGDRRVLREARTEAVVALALDVALLAGLAVADKAKSWSIVTLAWSAWLLLATPALVLMTVLLIAPAAELSPGRVRNAGIALLGMLVASDVVAVGVLVVALASSSTDSLSAGDLLAHRDGRLADEHHHLRPAVLAARRGRPAPARRARPRDPDFGFPQDAVPRAGWSPRLSDYLYVALTNGIAFSPTDTMPLTRRAKRLLAASR